MRLTTAIGLYALAVCALIFAGVTIMLESKAAEGVKMQAHRVTSLLQSEMVKCIDGEIANVEANVRRTASAFGELGRFGNERNLSTALKLMVDGDSTIIGGALAYLPEYAPTGYSRWMVYAQRTDSAIVTRQLANSGYDYTEMDWFAVPVSTGVACWSEPYFDNGLGECLMTTFSRPIRLPDGTVTGVVTADVDLSTLITALQKLKPYDTSRSFLIDDDGRLVGGDSIYADIDNTWKLIIDEIDHQVDNGVLRDQTFFVDSNQYLSNYSRLDGLGMIVCTVTPYHTVVSIFRSLRGPFAIVMAVGLILLFFGICAVLRYLSRPLAKLTESAVAIGKGDFNAEMPETANFTDLRKLRDAMVFMKTSIIRYIREIETATRKSERIRSELDIAARIQRSMLPGKWECADGVSISAILESAREVSGDMYDYVKSGRSVYVLIADVSGKGVPASLVMTAVLSLFRSEAGRGMTPAQILCAINRVISRGNTSCMFVTAIILRLCDGVLTISNAGHNPPLIMRDGQWEYMRINPALPLGIMEDTVYPDSTSRFSPNSKLLLYTDGLTEAENASSEQFSEDRVLGVLSSVGNASVDDIVSALRRSVAQFATDGLSDDLTIVCIGSDSDDAPVCAKQAFGYGISEISRIPEFLEKIHFPEQLVGKANLILEEAVANIIKHAKPYSSDDKIELSAETYEDKTIFIISDTGECFNPLECAPEVDTNLSAEDRPIGGLGIYMIRNLADDVEYSRENNSNILKIKIIHKL